MLDFGFEDAITPRIININKKIESFREKIHEIEQKIDDSEEEFDEDGERTETFLEFYSELGELGYEIDILLEQRFSIEELKLVALFKDFEIVLKKVISLSFPDTDLKNLFTWDNIKNVLKENEIKLSDIKNHNLINELRVTNNNIKHSDSIGDKVQKVEIKEFKDCEKFDNKSLSDFYDRIKKEPIYFLENLVELIIETLFVYDDGRINKIANQFGKRMDKKTMRKFAEVLMEKSI